MDQTPSRRPARDPVPRNPTREEYRRWAERQPGRYERVGGEVVAMNAERLQHVAVKMRVWQALDLAIRAAGLPCRAFGDGATVEVGDDTDYEPDALVTCDTDIDFQDIAAPSPVIVVEVASPSTQSIDSGENLADYFRVPSVQHYLIVRTQRREVIHHLRHGDGTVAKVVASGPLRLDPPGIVLAVEDFFVDLRS